MSRLLPFFGFVLLVALLVFGLRWNRTHDMNWVPSPLIDIGWVDAWNGGLVTADDVIAAAEDLEA